MAHDHHHHHGEGLKDYFTEQLLTILVCGLFVMVRSWGRPAVRVIAGWLAIGPLPAAFGTPAPHALRAIALLPALYLLASLAVGNLGRRLLSSPQRAGG